MTLGEILALDENCPGCPVCKPTPRSKGFPRRFPVARGPSRPAQRSRTPGTRRAAA